MTSSLPLTRAKSAAKTPKEAPKEAPGKVPQEVPEPSGKLAEKAWWPWFKRGATARAQINLARIKALCKIDCSAAMRLQTALNAPVVAAADTPRAAVKN